MADLLSIFAQAYPARSDSFITGAEGVQSMMNNALLYQQRREAMEAQRNLKNLYARNPQPTFEDLAKIDPAYAMQQQLSNVELQGKMLGMQKTQGDIQQQQAKVFAEAGAPVAEKYAQAALSGQMTPELMSRFHSELGSVLADVEKQHGIRPPAGFNIEALDPIGVLQRSMNYYKSPTMENFAKMQGEQMMSGVPQRPSFGDVAGRTEYGPYGPRYIPPVGMPGRGAGVTPFAPPVVQQEAYTTEGAMPSGMQPAPMTNVAEDLAKMKAVRAQMPVGRQRDAMDKMIADLEAGNVGQPSATPSATPAGSFVTPADEMRMRAEEERVKAGIQAEAAGMRKTAETQAEKSASASEQFSTLQALNKQDVHSLIDQSFTSKPEQFAKSVIGSEMLGMPSEANTATERLTVIAAQMRDMAKAIVGAGPISEGEQKIISKALGGIETAKDPDSRKAAYDQFVELALEKIKKYPHLQMQMNAIQDMSQGAAQPSVQPPTNRLRIGDVKNGYEYIGGNPNDQSSWRKSR